jgi:hypothetical protein
MDSRKGKNPPSEGQPGGGRRKRSRRRRGGGPETPDSAAQVLSKKPKPVDLKREDVGEPLTPQEQAALREHFRFLRDNRKELRLKVNAAEDLLLNGVKEPTHRGVCQHLLGKVERGAVLSAAERLAPAAAAKLLAGVIRFSADIEYVLLFLEKIKLSSSPAEATAALSQGLQRIDFDKVSAAQMRRVLNLVTELFDERQRPALLLGMLESRSFRHAFDSSISDLPEALAHLVLPLRAAQAVILHGRANPFDSETLRDGLHLLLDLDDKILLRHPLEVRRRLFGFGLQACSAPDHRLHRSLRMLLTSLPTSDRHKAELALALARHFMAAEQEAEARKVLEVLAGEYPDCPAPARWLGFLDAERLADIALLDEPAGLKDALGQHARRAGIDVGTLRAVWIQIGNPEHADSHETTAQLLSELCIPGVPPLLASGTTPAGEPYFVVAASGLELEPELLGKLEAGDALELCRSAVEVLAALATAGVQLPDASLRRFTREPRGALLLTDLAGAKRVEVEAAAAAHLKLARELCQLVLGEARRYLVPKDVVEAVSAARSCAELARSFARRVNPRSA